MKILYIVDNLDVESGVSRKAKQNASHWKCNRASVFFLSMDTLTVHNSKFETISEKKTLNRNSSRIFTAFRLFYNSMYLSEIVNKICPDIIYTRYQLYTPALHKILKRNKVIMEVNGDDNVEYKLKSKLTHYYNKLTRSMMFDSVDGFVFVSRELEKKMSKFNKPSTVISNGIGFSDYPFSEVKKFDRFSFAFITTPNQPWQGLEKVVALSEYYREYDFHIIGVEGVSKSNLIYHGYLPLNKANDIVKKCSIGIGTLSLYLQGLEEASPLKTRQYLALGLPVIYAYIDTDLDSNFSFCLKLDNTPSNLNFEKINHFIEHVQTSSNVDQKTRKFSETKLNYSNKEIERLSFFKRVING